MVSIKYNLDFDKLCNAYMLGQMIGKPTAVAGGLLHRMYRIQTAKGTYAVKAINPQIMKRPTAMPNYLFSEQVARIACKNGIPAMPAISDGGRFIVDVDGQYFMIFNWFEGKALPSDPAPSEKCYTIGTLLAEIHNTDFSSIDDGADHGVYPHKVDWKTLADRGEHSNCPWAPALKDNLVNIEEWERISGDAAKTLNCNMHVSHRDLGQKNVLWGSGGDSMIIDWEAAGYINPTQDMVESAFYWAGQEAGKVSRASFSAFVSGYLENRGTASESYEEAIAAGFQNKLEWIFYNIRRSLGEEAADVAECALGTEQVMLTLNSMVEYSKKMNCWYLWLHSLR